MLRLQIMSTLFQTRISPWPLLIFLTLAFGLTGCSTDDPVTPGIDPDPLKAAELTGAVQGPAEIGSTMTDLDMFLSPLQSLSEDVGIGNEAPIGGGWNDDGVSYDYPNKALMTAKAYRGVKLTNETGIAATVAQGSPLRQLSRLGLDMTISKAAGDTIAVIYFDTPDSTGLYALIETDQVDILRLVSQRTYHFAGLLQVAEASSEIVLDSNGTLDIFEDDSYFSVHHEFTLGNGEHTTGNIESEDGVSAMGPGVVVRAYHRVDDPSFHIFQEWNEAELLLDPGEFEIDGDEIIHELTATVHWRNDAEHTLTVVPEAGSAIGPDTNVLITGSFTASPDNTWLESTVDTLLARLGDLEDETDDLLLEITRNAVFDEIASDGGQARNYVRLTPSEPISPGQEPCGGTAEQEIYYPATWWLLHLTRNIDINCDGSGSMSVTMEFQDGSSYTRTITWDGLGGATLAETRADGTVVVGSFDESTGAYSLVTTFSLGHDPISRDRHGTAVEGSVEAWETVTWQDGHDDQTYFSMTETLSETTVTGYRIESDVREDFTLTESANGDSNGSWSSSEGAEGQFEMEMLDGGGHRLTFSASDLNAEGSPSMSGKIDFAPDGSGIGTITFTQYGVSVTYDVVIGPDGTGILTDAAGNVFPL